MAGDGFFFLGILVLFFILWATTGGPSRPISFQGPYITPITNTGQEQSGYGPAVHVGGTLTLPGASLTATERPTATPTAPANTSSYSGIVSITHETVSSSGTTATDGYIQVVISSSAGKDVDVTNWKIKSLDTGAVATIPTGILVMKLGTTNTLQDIALRPGDKASITTAASPVNASFATNSCTAYLRSNQSVYNSCVNGHANDVNFLLGTWYVYLNQTAGVWKSNGDTVELIDTTGNVVASTAY